MARSLSNSRFRYPALGKTAAKSIRSRITARRAAAHDTAPRRAAPAPAACGAASTLRTVLSMSHHRPLAPRCRVSRGAPDWATVDADKRCAFPRWRAPCRPRRGRDMVHREAGPPPPRVAVPRRRARCGHPAGAPFSPGAAHPLKFCERRHCRPDPLRVSCVQHATHPGALRCPAVKGRTRTGRDAVRRRCIHKNLETGCGPSSTE